MSPLTLRRYRAERLLRREFEGQREQVLGVVRGRLRSRGVALDEADLEECYGQAWQGLYTALLEGQEIENPSGWLVLVCFRRAIDEARSRSRHQQHSGADPSTAQEPWESASAVEPDLAGALDDRAKLRHTFEALRERLGAREREAASLCYLQGLTRAQAAARMGISEARMRKLMEGRGPERPGVAAKVEELLGAVRGGVWCEQQGSLMRAFAFGILDPEGERYRLAQLHRRECPACRAYVISLRGLAAVLPPLALPWGPGAIGFGGGAAAGAGAGGGAGAGAGGGAGAGAGAGVGAGTGVGSFAAKLTAGCLLVAGVGGGCVAIVAGASHAPRNHGANTPGAYAKSLAIPPRTVSPAVSVFATRLPTRTSRTRKSRVHSRRLSFSRSAAEISQRARLEFGFEHMSTAGSSAARAIHSGNSGSATREFGIE